jgi:hypothetical protein
MMAFYTKIDEVGRKTFYPTPELEKMLQKQDRIADKDLRVFRSSNRMQRLLEDVLSSRGFKRDYDAREWRKKSAQAVKKSIFDWADKAMQPFKFADEIKPPLLQQVLKMDSVSDDELDKYPDYAAATKFLKEHGWWHREENKTWYSPQNVNSAPKVTVAQLIHESWAHYMQQFGQHPNALFISEKCLFEFRDEHPYGLQGIHYGSTYQGMVLYRGENGVKPYCCTIAELNKGMTPMAELMNEKGEVVAKIFQEHQKALLKHLKLGVGDIVPVKKERAPKAVKPKPPKKITPPSQMGRKLLSD